MPESPYDSFVADYYDDSPVVAGRRDVQFYLQAAHEFGDPLLELGCGTGRIALALAGAGLRVTGLDLSSRMIERAATKRDALLREARERVHLIQGDMAEFDLGDKFRLILIPFRPLQHLLETQQQLDCLACVKKHLVRGGRLIVDFFQTDPRRMHDPSFLEERIVSQYEMSGRRKVVLTEHVVAFHRAQQRNDVEMIYHVTHPDGHQEHLVFAFTLRYFFRYEVEHLFARAGFRVEALYGDFDRSPLRDDSPEMIFVASLA